MIEKCNEITGVWREEVCVWGGGGSRLSATHLSGGDFLDVSGSLQGSGGGGGESRGGGGVTGLSAADSLET